MTTNETEMATISGEEVAALLGPTLDQFEVAAQTPLRKVADTLYDILLRDVQAYLRDNAQWNIAAEIDRCRRIERENTRLQSELTAAKEALDVAGKALREHACHGGENEPCRRAAYQCNLECGKQAGDALLIVEATLSTIGGGK